MRSKVKAIIGRILGVTIILFAIWAGAYVTHLIPQEHWAYIPAGATFLLLGVAGVATFLIFE